MHLLFGAIRSKTRRISEYSGQCRAALIRILSAFKTAATQPLEVKTYVLPARLRLKKRAYNVVVSLSEVSLWTGVALLLPQRLNNDLGMSLQPA